LAPTPNTTLHRQRLDCLHVIACRQPGIADFITRHRAQNDYPAKKTIKNADYWKKQF